MQTIARIGLMMLVAAFGWQTPVDRLRASVGGQAESEQFSGVVLVADGERTILELAAGTADRSASIPITLDTRFNLGSINKSFTAVAIALLAQQGKLAFADPIGKHLKDYPNRDAAAAVTIHHLLTHGGGIAPYTSGGLRGARSGSTSIEELVALFATEPLRFEPGTRQEYSNAGYVLLGRIVEVVSGTSYDDYIARHVYAPAGMTHTGFVAVPPAAPGIAKGYVALGPDGRPVMMRPGAGAPPPGAEPPQRGENSAMVEPGNPAGGGYSTARDLLAFARALQRGALLDAAMTDRLLNGTARYALREDVVNGRRFVGNGGGAPGINAEFRFELSGRYAVVVLSNFSPPSATNVMQETLRAISE